jgi:hypothetical protein
VLIDNVACRMVQWRNESTNHSVSTLKKWKRRWKLIQKHHFIVFLACDNNSIVEKTLKQIKKKTSLPLQQPMGALRS